jgi:hypothetical protein
MNAVLRHDPNIEIPSTPRQDFIGRKAQGARSAWPQRHNSKKTAPAGLRPLAEIGHEFPYQGRFANPWVNREDLRPRG